MDEDQPEASRPEKPRFAENLLLAIWYEIAGWVGIGVLAAICASLGWCS